MNQPVVILCRPEIPENIGFTARCLKGFGIEDLRLVGIAKPEPDSRAYWTARSGSEVLDKARCFATLPEALADCHHAFGFTRRVRERSQTLNDLGAINLPAEGRTALVFGPESDGLSQEDVMRMTHLVRIPLADPELSLNLSHAVAIALYALSGKPSQPAVLDPFYRPASLAESEAAMEQVLEVLDRNGFLAKGKKEAARRENLRILWKRVQPSRGELDFLCGALKALSERADA